MAAMSGYQRTTGLALFLSLWSFAEGGKLLVVPQDGNHWLSMCVAVEMFGEKRTRRCHDPRNHLAHGNIRVLYNKIASCALHTGIIG